MYIIPNIGFQRHVDPPRARIGLTLPIAHMAGSDQFDQTRPAAPPHWKSTAEKSKDMTLLYTGDLVLGRFSETRQRRAQLRLLIQARDF